MPSREPYLPGLPGVRQRRLPRVPRVAVRRVVGDLNQHSFTERFARLETAERALAERQTDVARARGVLEEEAAEALARFGLDWRAVPLHVVDLLAWVRSEGEHWTWEGRVNNHGLPVMRIRHRRGEEITTNTEWSASKMLHALLAGDHDAPLAMRASCGQQSCVRPSHRCRSCTL